MVGHPADRAQDPRLTGPSATLRGRGILHVVALLALPSPFDRLAAKAASTGYGLKVLAESGIIRPYSPLALARAGRILQQWGTGPAGGFLAMATLLPDRVWIIDERGDLTFGEVDRRTNALARALHGLGVGEGDSVALMARNHRGFVEATIAAAKLGADLIYLNTAFAGPQLVDVLEREGPTVVIHDEEFTGMLEKANVGPAGALVGRRRHRSDSWHRHPRRADRGRAQRCAR